MEVSLYRHVDLWREFPALPHRPRAARGEKPRAASFGDAVGEQQQAVPRIESHQRVFVFPIGKHADYSAGVLQFLHRAIRTNQDWQRMARIRVTQ